MAKSQIRINFIDQIDVFSPNKTQLATRIVYPMAMVDHQLNDHG
jgi:hypothetical protein